MKTFFSKFILLIFGFSPFLVATNVLASYNYIPMESIPGFGKPSNFSDYVMAVYKFGLWGIGITAIFMLMFGGYTYLTSAGNTARTGKAKEIITDALIGVFMALVSWLLLYTINPDLVKIPASIISSSNNPATVSFQNPYPSLGVKRVKEHSFLTHINITGKGSYSLESLTLSKDNKDVTSNSTSGLNNNVIFVNIPQSKLEIGTYTLNITVRNQNNQTFTSKDNLSFEIINVSQPLTLETTSLAEGVSGEDYSETLTATGGRGIQNYILTADTLPPGLKLDGLTLSGTPTLKGTYHIKFTLQDGTNIIVKKELSLTIKKGSSLVPSPGEEDECQNISDTHCKGNQIQYCKEQGDRLVWGPSQDCPNGESCSEGECGGGGNVYGQYVSIYNQGNGKEFKDLYNPDNLYLSQTRYGGRYRIGFNITTNSADDDIEANHVEKIPDYFKVFIPPGTTWFSVDSVAYVHQDVGTAFRYRKPPEHTYTYSDDSSQINTMVQTPRKILSIASSQDIYIKNSFMHMLIQTLDNSEHGQPFTVEESGWLYAKIFPFKGSGSILASQIAIDVDADTYRDWHNNVGQPGSEYVWDANGNPVRK